MIISIHFVISYPEFYRFVLMQAVPEPTHINLSGSSTLIACLVISSFTQLVNFNVIPPSNSDHNGFTLTLNPPPVKARKCSIWKYSQADFEKANRLNLLTGLIYTMNLT